jgi:hypothetical protein
MVPESADATAYCDLCRSVRSDTQPTTDRGKLLDDVLAASGLLESVAQLGVGVRTGLQNRLRWLFRELDPEFDLPARGLDVANQLEWARTRLPELPASADVSGRPVVGRRRR